MTVLDRAGQQAFWDRQAPDYDAADMTLDNEGELKIVESLTRDQLLKNGHIDDVVTLGGAVGSRDPKVVVDIVQGCSSALSHIYFNDLSPKMTSRAVDTVLKPYISDKTGITTFPGPIHEVGDSIPCRPRRVVIGVYRARALIEAYPHLGYSLSGIEEYIKNSSIIGTRLTVEPLDIRNGVYAKPVTQLQLTPDSSAKERVAVNNEIVRQLERERVDAIRIIGTHEDKDGFFISHWFTEEGIINLVRRSFKRDRRGHLSIVPCAKGYVLCIDPIEKPQGMVTILNNVIGNILPDEQIRTLEVIDRISS